MAGDGRIPRSVADATRFTPNTPHANVKSTPPSASSASSSKPNPASPSTPNKATSSSPAGHQPQPRRAAPQGGAAAAMGRTQQQQTETIEERVRRLRAAHLAAKQHDVSRFDRVAAAARRYFDAAHKFTVLGLIGFSGIALFVTVYATADMMMYNRKRRSEFFALQKKLGDDSLEAARLAYMTGTATDEQVALVEDATARAKQTGVPLPSLLSAPQTAAPPGGWAEHAGAAAGAERSAWPGESLAESSTSAASDADEAPRKKGLSAWLFGGLKKEDDAVPSTGDSGTHEGASATAVGSSSSSSSSSLARAVDDSQQAIRDRAKAAFDGERENQRRGGPLDQVGLDAGARGPEEGKKKGGWLW